MKEQPISERDRRRRRALIVFQIVIYGYLLVMFLIQIAHVFGPGLVGGIAYAYEYPGERALPPTTITRSRAARPNGRQTNGSCRARSSWAPRFSA